MTTEGVKPEDFEAFNKALRRLGPKDHEWVQGLSIELSGNAVKRIAMQRFKNDDSLASAARTVFVKLKQYPALRRLITGS